MTGTPSVRFIGLFSAIVSCPWARQNRVPSAAGTMEVESPEGAAEPRWPDENSAPPAAAAASSLPPARSASDPTPLSKWIHIPRPQLLADFI